ncbi:MAG: gfo/Idh/MocA family oxidoreductase [Spirochaetaceae bacterium]|nr:MAG: gfo/Idh/MocA family oxidoreductase [Spirochaetaceae bacterium]
MSGVTGIGIVGAQFAGRFHAEIWRTLPEARVVAVADLSAEARDGFARAFGPMRTYQDLAGLLSDGEVEVVDLCVPNFLHAEMAIASMEAGRHVICEKPLATRLDDGERVVEVQQKTARRYFYAEDWIFAPALVRAEQIIREGGIGRPLFFKGQECHNGSHSPYARTIAYCGGGSVIHVGIHPIGYAYHLFGLPQRVTGCCSGGSGQNFVHTDFEGEDWGLGVLHYHDGRQALIEGNYITTGGMDDRVEVYGSDGVVKVDLTFGSPLSVFSRNGISYAVEKAEFTQGWTRPAINENESLGYKDELTHFLGCIRHNGEQVASTTAEAGHAVLRVVDAIYRSNREGRTVTLA